MATPCADRALNVSENPARTASPPSRMPWYHGELIDCAVAVDEQAIPLEANQTPSHCWPIATRVGPTAFGEGGGVHGDPCLIAGKYRFNTRHAHLVDVMV